MYINYINNRMRKLNKKGLKRSFPRLPKYQKKGSTTNTAKYDVFGDFKEQMQYQPPRLTPDMQKRQDDVIMAKTLAAYNMGPTALNRLLSKLDKQGVDVDMSLDWIDSLPEETKDYIQKITGLNESFNADYNKAIKANPNIYQEYYLPMRDADAVPVDILMRQAFAESSFRPNVVSGSNAKGLTQFNDITIQEYANAMNKDVKDIDPFDPSQSVLMQEWYMNKLKNQFRQAGGPAGNQQARQPSLAEQISFLINEEGLEIQEVLEKLRMSEIPDQQIANALMQLGATEEQLQQIFKPQQTIEDTMQEDIAAKELEQAKDGKFIKKAGQLLRDAVRSNPYFMGNFNNPFLPEYYQPMMAYKNVKTPRTIFGNIGQGIGKTIEFGANIGNILKDKRPMTSAKKRKPIYEDQINYDIDNQDYVEDPNDLDSKSMREAMKKQAKSFESMYYKGGDVPMYQMGSELTFEEWMKQNYPNASMMDFTKAEEYQSYLDSLDEDDDFDFSNMEFNVTGLPKKTPFKDAMGKARDIFSEVGAYGVGIASEISDIGEIIKDYEEQARTQYATADKRYGSKYLQKPDYRGAFIDGQFSESQTPFFARNGNGEKIKRRKRIGKKFRRDPLTLMRQVIKAPRGFNYQEDVSAGDTFEPVLTEQEVNVQYSPRDFNFLKGLMRKYETDADVNLNKYKLGKVPTRQNNPSDFQIQQNMADYDDIPFLRSEYLQQDLMPELFQYGAIDQLGNVTLQRRPMSRIERDYLRSYFEEMEKAEMGGMVVDADSDLIAKLIAAGADIEML